MTSTLGEARRQLTQALRSRGVHAYEATTSKYDVFASTAATEFTLSFMPGNRRTVISHAVKVFPDYRNKGIGTQMCKLREDAARDAGITLMLATVVDSNWGEVRVLEKCGWVRLTQNTVSHCSLWGKQIKE